MTTSSRSTPSKPFAHDSGHYLFAANRTPDGRRKDTVVNAETSGCFAWNMATWDLREAVNRSAMAVAPDVDEFTLAEVTPVECIDIVAPRVAQSPVHFECRYMSTHSIDGASPVGGVDVVFARVVRIHIDDAVVAENGKLDIPRIRPIARMGYYDYTVVDEVFEMRIPGASDDVLAGLEGRTSR